jgi:cobyrinic acid a,c-diamide synthase
MRAALRAFASEHKPIYAECGGLMYLADAIISTDGVRHQMIGLIEGSATMSDKLQALGYVEIETRTATLLGPAGTRFRGHQFRYSHFESRSEPARYAMRVKRTGQVQTEGYGQGSVLASYVHAHWAGQPAVADAFVAACTRATTS